jgi:hypothetical protein
VSFFFGTFLFFTNPPSVRLPLLAKDISSVLSMIRGSVFSVRELLICASANIDVNVPAWTGALWDNVLLPNFFIVDSFNIVAAKIGTPGPVKNKQPMCSQGQKLQRRLGFKN